MTIRQAYYTEQRAARCLLGSVIRLGLASQLYREAAEFWNRAGWRDRGFICLFWSKGCQEQMNR